MTGVRRFVVPLIVGAAMLLPVDLVAQRSGDGFLFRTPRIQLGLRLGYAGAAAGSEIFDFVTDSLTLDRGDFGGALIGGELAYRASERLDVVLAFSNTSTRTRSEFRNLVEETPGGDLPIEQETTFSRRPVTLSARYYLADRGRSISRFAWIPGGVAPYVGAGIGVMWYSFEQDGDFVDYVDYTIFSDRLRSNGSAFMQHLLAGLEFSVSPRVVSSVDVRYEWASADMDGAFGPVRVDGRLESWEPIDLSGFQVSVGLGLRF